MTIDFDDIDTLYRAAEKYNEVDGFLSQDAAMKFLFGQLKTSRRELQSNRDKGKDIYRAEWRIKTIKALIATVSKLEFDD